MAKVPVALRLDPAVLVRIDAYAAARKVSRQVVMETFVLSGLDDSGRGVVELVEAERKTKPAPGATVPPGPTQHDLDMDRQRALNTAKYRRAS